MKNQTEEACRVAAKKSIPITVEILKGMQDQQLLKLESNYLNEIGEGSMDLQREEQLKQAVEDGRITFFVAKHGCQAVGMCSVSRYFSTFACADTGVFEDFYVKPEFRKQGVARLLAQAAHSWCRENHVSSLTVCCAPCDEAMYQALGFDVRLGSAYTCLI